MASRKRPYPTNQESHRIILHIDVDSFYTAAECLRDPSLRGKPFVVKQGHGGGFVAVSYEARAFGVRKGDGVGARGRANIEKLKGHVSEAEAREKCGGKLIVRDMDTVFYRKVSSELLRQIEVICDGMVVEKASIDDFYVSFDKSACAASRDKPLQESEQAFPNTFLATKGLRGRRIENLPWNKATLSINEGRTDSDSDDCEEDENLFQLISRRGCAVRDGPPAVETAVFLAQKLRSGLDLPVTVGIAKNKYLAKLTGGLNKPAGVTILQDDAVDKLLMLTPLRKLPGFRGKLGEVVEEFLSSDNKWCQVAVFDLRRLTSHHLNRIEEMFGKEKVKGLQDLGRGIDASKVESKGLAKTIIAEKSFSPGSNFGSFAQALSKQLVQRLLTERKNSMPRQLVFKWRHGYTSLSTTASKTVEAPAGLAGMLQKDVASSAMAIESLCAASVPDHGNVTRLLIGATGFISTEISGLKISSFLLPESEKKSICPARPSSATPGIKAPTIRLNKEEKQLPTPQHYQTKEKVKEKSELQVGQRCITCPICSRKVLQSSADAHVESHFSSSLAPSSPKPRRRSPTISSFFKKKH
uniref:UmuC domain-containing protein n=1 Tax=Odontella aurita TaxID=265563 RepID=A0A7S4K5I6_9STRA